MKTKWKYSRELRAVLADYLALKLGLVSTEEEIAFLLTNPDFSHHMLADRYCPGGQLKRVETALRELQAEESSG